MAPKAWDRVDLQPAREKQSPDCVLPFQFLRGHLQRPLFLSGLPKAVWPSLEYLCSDGFLHADWNELKVAAGLIENVKGRGKRKGFLSQPGI